MNKIWTEEEFKENSFCNRNTDEEELIYDRWEGAKYEKEEFRGAWIKKLKLEE